MINFFVPDQKIRYNFFVPDQKIFRKMWGNNLFVENKMRSDSLAKGERSDRKDWEGCNTEDVGQKQAIQESNKGAEG